MQTIPSSATEALKQAACAAYDGMIKAFPTTGTGSIEKADIEDCLKKFEEKNKYEMKKNLLAKQALRTRSCVLRIFL